MATVAVCAVALGVIGVDQPSGRQGIDPLETHEYTVRIESPGTYKIVVEHDGSDVVLTAQAAGTDELLRADIPNRHLGEEYLLIDGEGEYRTRIINGTGDRNDWYELSVKIVSEGERIATHLSSVATSAVRSPDAKQRLLEQALSLWRERGNLSEQSRLLFALGSLFRSTDRLAEATSAYRRAAELEQQASLDRRSLWSQYAAGEMLVWQDELDEARAIFTDTRIQSDKVADPELTGASRNYIALTYLIRGDLEEARRQYVALSTFLDKHGLRHQLATVYHNLGGTHLESGEPLQALDFFQRAIALDKEINPGASVAETLEEIGGLYAMMGRCDLAFVHLNEALAELTMPSSTTSEPSLNKRTEGRIVNRIGNCYRDLGDLGAAIEFYNRALALRQEAGDQRGVAYTLDNLGDAYRRRGSVELAIETHTKSAASHRDRGDLLGYTASLVALGNDHVALGDYDAAISISEQALASAKENGYGGHEARSHRLTGDAYVGRNDVERAARHYDQALAAFRRTNNQAGELETLSAKALMYSETGDSSRAVATTQTALRFAETIRAGIASPDLRARFIAALQDLYITVIDATLSDAEGRTDGRVALGLQMNDRRRARVLREELALASESLDAKTAERYRMLRASLGAKLLKRQSAIDRGLSDVSDELADEIGRLRINLLALDTEVARDNRRWRQVVAAPATNVTDIQSQIPRNSVVVDFAFGNQAVHVWSISDSELDYARYEPVQTGFDTEGRATQALQSLLTEAFGRVSDRFSGKTDLIVIPDGPISVTQLANVRIPTDRFLIDRFSISLTPSITLVDLRDGTEERLEKLALIGDPVFGTDFMKVSGESPKHDGLSRSMRSLDMRQLQPLPYSGFEIEQISRIAEGKAVLVLRGLDASKARVLGEISDDHDIVHFATHGFINAQIPELSGIVLSLVNSAGEPIDGFLTLTDVYRMRDIGASLVVLSGCRTGLGEQVRGEGPMSLARAFMQNGVEHILATQWEVPDRATADLMIAFYEGLLHDGLTPAGALAAAQRKIKRNSRWEDPFYWAGFTLWSAKL